MKSLFTISNNDTSFSYDVTEYPGGELGVEIRMDKPTTVFLRDTYPTTVTITAHIRDVQGVWVLGLLKDAIEEFYLTVFRVRTEVMLVLPYVPYARQDRVTRPGESFTLRAFARYINSLNFTLVEITDPHSDVTHAVINNSRVVDIAHRLAMRFEYFSKKGFIFVAPDTGAMKKVSMVAELHRARLAIASKHRDTATGKLSGFSVDLTHEEVCGKRFLIIDDICDGGGTFVGLAKVLRDKGAVSVELYVTHGIFSRGLPLEGIDHVYSLYPWITDTENLTNWGNN